MSKIPSNKAFTLKGFTLIEMMVVIGIIAILALIALPSQVSKMNRQKVAESIGLVSGYRSYIATEYAITGQFPVDNAATNIPEPEKIIGHYMKSLHIEDGAMHLTFGNKFKSQEGEILTIYPVYVEESPLSPISWVCGYDEIPQGMTAAGENKTTIEMANLPISCRGKTQASSSGTYTKINPKANAE